MRKHSAEEACLALAEGFPRASAADVAAVVGRLPLSAGNARLMTEERVAYTLLSGEEVRFPYRVYLPERPLDPALSPEQRTVWHCIYSRSSDGFVREAHIQALLEGDTPHWAAPYVLKVCDEYVMEILELVYRCLSRRDTAVYKEVCRRNLPHFVYSHSRMISYWNEFYRTECYHYRNYVGKALFEQCFGYTRSMEKAVFSP